MNLSEERGRILRMVASGEISPAEAEDLLSALEPPRQSESRPFSSSGNLSAPPPPTAPQAMMLRRTQARSLVIHISEGDETKVDVRIPLGLARAASKFIPRKAKEYLEEYDMNVEQLLESLVNAEGTDTLVEIHDDENHVRIAVE
jgi:phage tail tape-measure protein